MKTINSDGKVISSEEIRKEWQEVDLGIDLPPGYRVYLHPNGEMQYLIFKKEIVLVFVPEKKRLIELLDTVLAHEHNQKK